MLFFAALHRQDSVLSSLSGPSPAKGKDGGLGRSHSITDLRSSVSRYLGRPRGAGIVELGTELRYLPVRITQMLFLGGVKPCGALGANG